MAKAILISQHKLRKYVALALILATFVSSLFISMRAFACGGPNRYDLDTPMHTLDYLLEQLVTSGDIYEIITRDEFLFLYPFKLEKPKEMKPLWTMIYTYDAPVFTPPSTGSLVSALRSSDWKTAETEARKIVNQVLDLPAVVADKYQPQFIQALEFLEARPLLKNTDPALIKFALLENLSARKIRQLPVDLRDVLEVRRLDRNKVDEIIKAKPRHPRIATLRFVSLRNEFARTIPDGWVYDIRKKVNKETWRQLERSADLWLKDYPQHPLADLVLLWKIRIYYFEGDDKLAWQTLLAVYPRHLPRVLYEMRFLVMYSSLPEELLDMVQDPLLFTALLHTININAEQWEKWWKVSEEYRSRAWATNFQERLLEKLVQEARPGKLPPSFPNEPLNPTPLWGKLRALALMKAERWNDAEKQLFSLAPDNEQALLTAAYYLRRGKTSMAAQVIDLPEHIRQYLIRVMLDDGELRSLTSAKNAVVRQEALFEQGVRLAARGKWGEASKNIQTVDAARSELWQRAAVLSKDDSPTGHLQWARFLKGNNDKLMYGNDSAWYRSVNDRYQSVSNVQKRVKSPQQEDVENGEEIVKRPSWEIPWTPKQEQVAITQHLTRTAEMWLALQAYVDWLSTAKPSPQKSAVIKEADACYNWLINWNSTNSKFWNNYLRENPVVQQLREAGKRTKNR